MQLIENHIPYLKTKASDTLSPMGYTAQICKERWPEYKTVFIGPCLAKKIEAAKKFRSIIDGVITYSELAAIFVGKDIDVKEMEDADLGATDSFKDCREFALTAGTAGCVMSRFESSRENVRVLPINGLDKKTVRLMKTWEKRAPEADLVEVMCCEGGCIAGPGTIVKPQLAIKLREAARKAK